jgi:hypothetical protein
MRSLSQTGKKEHKCCAFISDAVANIFGAHLSGFCVDHLGIYSSDVSRPIPELHSCFRSTGNPGPYVQSWRRLITGPSVKGFEFNKKMAIEENEDVAPAAGFREDRAHALETRGRPA